MVLKYVCSVSIGVYAPQVKGGLCSWIFLFYFKSCNRNPFGDSAEWKPSHLHKLWKARDVFFFSLRLCQEVWLQRSRNALFVFRNYKVVIARSHPALEIIPLPEFNFRWSSLKGHGSLHSAAYKTQMSYLGRNQSLFFSYSVPLLPSTSATLRRK